MKAVYETLRTYKGVFVFLNEHQSRLRQSCHSFGLKCPDLKEVLKEFGKAEVKVRINVSEKSVDVEWEILPEWHGSFLWEEVWPVKSVNIERKNPEVKSANTTPQTEARETAEKDGFKEVLLVNQDGFIKEGSKTNVFFIKDGVVITAGEAVLPGISRHVVLEACKALGIKVELRDLAEEELKDCEAEFLTNSIRGMIATGAVHSLMIKIANWCSEFVGSRIDLSKK